MEHFEKEVTSQTFPAGMSISALAIPPDTPEDHPAFKFNPWPALVSRRRVWEMVTRHGVDNPIVQARVFSEFPSGETSSSLLSLADIEAYPRANRQSQQIASSPASTWPVPTMATRLCFASAMAPRLFTYNLGLSPMFEAMRHSR